MQSIELKALGEAVLALGEEGFAGALMRAIGMMLEVEHLALLRFDPDLTARLLGAASTGRGNQALEAGRLYERAGFFRHDPGMTALAGGHPSEPMLYRLRAADIEDTRYRRDIYERFDLLERLSILDQIRGQWIMVNLYRSTGQVPFTGSEVGRMREFAALVLPLAAKHATLIATGQPATGPSPSVGFLDDLLERVDSRLSVRERAVCARALAGLTVPGIASDLKVSAATVATLRRRAYAKLGITSLNELFARCIGVVALHGPRGARTR